MLVLSFDPIAALADRVNRRNLIVIALAFAACENEKECAQRKCPTAGQTPMLIKGECICFETAKKGESR